VNEKRALVWLLIDDVKEKRFLVWIFLMVAR
jgi:hypothetical protein